MNKSCPEMYLVYKDNFWNCKCLQTKRKDTKCYSVKIRTGKVKGQNIDLLSVDVLPSVIFDDEQLAIKFVSDNVQHQLERGYHEADPKTIRNSIDQQLTINQDKTKNSHKDQKESKIMTRILPQFKESVYKNPRLLKAKNENGFKILLAETWHEGIDPKGYLLSEKLDGMRALWRDNKIISKNNNNIILPHYFTEGWPHQTLDGELWIGRGQYKPLITITKRELAANFQEWQGVKYMVFDLPDVQLPFKKRLSLLKQIVEQTDSPYLQLVQHVACKGVTELQEQLVAIESMGGEGIMLRNPDSQYEGRRSRSILKVKSVPDDEAVVIGYEDGVGRNSGTISGLLVQTKENICFTIISGLNYEKKRNAPRIGSVITYKYFGITKDGQPRFPIFLRVRED